MTQRSTPTEEGVCADGETQAQDAYGACTDGETQAQNGAGHAHVRWSLRSKEQDGEAASGETQARLSCGSQSTRNAEKPEAAASTPQSWTHRGTLRTTKLKGKGANGAPSGG